MSGSQVLAATDSIAVVLKPANDLGALGTAMVTTSCGLLQGTIRP